MRFQRNASISGSRICPCPARRCPPLWGCLGIVEDTWFKVPVESTTTIQRPTSIGWAFSFPGSTTPRGVRRRFACATPWRPGVLKSPSSTLFCSQFSQNLRQLLRRSTRRRPFVAVTCTCVTAIGCPSRLDDQGIRPAQGLGPLRRASSTALRAAAWSRGLGRHATAQRTSSP